MITTFRGTLFDSLIEVLRLGFGEGVGAYVVLSLMIELPSVSQFHILLRKIFQLNTLIIEKPLREIKTMKEGSFLSFPVMV